MELKYNTSLQKSKDFQRNPKNIRYVNIPQALVSFDIVNLYTNIPVIETLDIFRDKLEHANNLKLEEINELEHPTELVLLQKYFDLNILLTVRMSYGVPLSSILAQLFLDHV